MSTWAPPTARFFLVVMVIAVGCRTYAADAPAPPNTAIIPVPKLEQDSYDWYARHDAILAAQSQLKPEVVMIGDSITHFWSGTPQANLQNGPHAWRQLFGPHAVLNMGFGWDRTQNVLWRLAHGEFSGIAPRYVVLNIGTNNFSATKNARANTPAEVAAAIDLICTRLHERAPDSRLIIMGVFPRGERPTDPVRAEIIALNKLLPAVAKSHNAVFLDIGPQFLNADGTLPKTLMADFCHPTEQGYAVWANALKPYLAPVRPRSAPPVISSSWDDLLEGVKTPADWHSHRAVLKQRYLDLIRDDQKPAKPPLDLQRGEASVVDGQYTRWLVSYNVAEGERAQAYLGIPLKLSGRAPAIVALHGTFAQGKERAAGLVDNPDKAYLDHLCRRGYVVIAPDHFVAGARIPSEGSYETKRFYEKHPNWTAVGKFTYEHSIAIDVLQSLSEVDPERIGTLGHSLGGHGALFLAAYDSRIKAAVCNCGGSFFRHNAGVENWARDHWYVYFKHIRPDLIAGRLPPIDFHEIIALIAPRAYLDISALNDGDPLTQRQRVLMLMKVMDVYELEKAPENFAFFVHGRGHSVPYASRQLMYGWMDTHLKPPEATQAQRVAAPSASQTPRP